ncbi:MAG: hypothetical protein VCB99_10315, partial [Myxococcota bacterium]
MRKGGDKFLLGFFGFGIFVYLLSLLYGGDLPAVFSENLPSVDTGTLIASPLTDTMTVIEDGISLASYSLKAETATHWKLPGRL